MKRKILIVPLLWLAVMVCAQTQTFRGVVTDVSGEPLIGASVLVQGTTNGTITDFDGNYEITCAVGAPLEFSYMGYKSQTIPAAGDLKIVLMEDNEQLEEVVVIGYGSLSKKEVSSSIVQVDSKNFVKGPMNNPMEMLNGKVAGLTVNSTSAADPNASSSLQIRSAVRVRSPVVTNRSTSSMALPEGTSATSAHRI